MLKKYKISRPLTLTEKILFLHLYDDNNSILDNLKRGIDYLELKPDRVAMQDATAQMALLQFINSDKKDTEVPASIHCDHLIRAKSGVKEDIENAIKENKEVYDFLEDASIKYGIDFWGPGLGIIHQIILENYAFPGGLIIGTDSHTPNAGGLSMIGIGVGGADAVDSLLGMPWELKFPKIIGVKLSGKLSEWASPKDVILYLAKELTVKGGTGHIIEYFGEGSNTISATGKATICNMGAEVGATSSIFVYDDKMADYLKLTNRGDIVNKINSYLDNISPDKEVLENPNKYYDKFIEIDLRKLEPRLNGPFTPDLSYTVSEIKNAVIENDYPDIVKAGLIGSCTNSSYEDIDRITAIAKQCIDKGIKPKAKLYLSPGSKLIKDTIESPDNGQLEILSKFGVILLANACGPCIGMWEREDINEGEKNTIITSFNRNFAKRNDGNINTYAFVSSPEMVMYYAISGKLSFNPITDFVENEEGEKIKLNPPIGKELPISFNKDKSKNVFSKGSNKNHTIIINPKSDRLQLLEKFNPFNDNDLIDMPVLIKVKGKCTTDHISMGGAWLKYRGHLDNISNNTLISAINSYTLEAGKVKNMFTGEYDTVPIVARDYKARQIKWVIIGDENYGEGSSREHAAMQPRHLGGVAVISKSFARIHETNLKKQGMLALSFDNPADYDKIQEDDKISIIGLQDFSPNKPLQLSIKRKDESTETITVNHTFNEKQIKWFKCGSALNFISSKITPNP